MIWRVLGLGLMRLGLEKRLRCEYGLTTNSIAYAYDKYTA